MQRNVVSQDASSRSSCDSLKTCLNYDGTSNKKLMVRTVCALLQRSPLHQAVVLSQSIASDRAERTRAARHP